MRLWDEHFHVQAAVYTVTTLHVLFPGLAAEFLIAVTDPVVSLSLLVSLMVLPPPRLHLGKGGGR